jgi:hypothetical protein
VLARAVAALSTAGAGLAVGLLLPYDAWHGAVPALIWAAGVAAVIWLGGEAAGERSAGRAGVLAMAALLGLGMGAAARSIDVGGAAVVACTAGTLTATAVGALVAVGTPRRAPAVLRWLLVLVASPVVFALLQPLVTAVARTTGPAPEDDLALGWAAVLLGAVNVAFALGATRRHQAAAGTPLRAWSAAAAWVYPLAGVNGPVLVALFAVGEFLATPVGVVLRVLRELP